MENALHQGIPMRPPLVPNSSRGGIFFSSDDILFNQIVQLHEPDPSNVNVRPLFQFVTDIISLLDDAQKAEYLQDQSDAKGINVTFDDLHLQIPDLAHIVKKISAEMKRKPESLDTDLDPRHQIAVSVLKILKRYSWEAKVVITLTSAATIVGDTWFRIYALSRVETEHLAILMVEIRKLDVNALKLQLESTRPLISAIIDLTGCIVEFGKLLSTAYISHQHPEFKAALTHFPVAVYWIIRGAEAVVTQIGQFSILQSLQYRNISSNDKSLELNWLQTYTNYFKIVLDKLKDLIKVKKQIDDYNKIKNIIYSTIQIDNIIVLKSLINDDDDFPALYHGPSKRTDYLDILRRKNVLLLISALDITHEELYILKQRYNEAKVYDYEIIWIPVIDSIHQWTKAMEDKVEALKNLMPWYSVKNHSSLNRTAVIKFFKDDWNFHGKPMLVVLDPLGKVVNSNAIHVMWIWNNQAFPFTSVREEALWEHETWRLEFLVDAIDQKVLDWIREGKYIFLYGGDNLEWIRKFTYEAQNVAQALQVPLEMVYVGKSHDMELVSKICASITMEQLSHCWRDPTSVWYFWTRIESMIYSKIQLGYTHDHADTIWQEIQKLHSHDKSHSGWVVLAKGSSIIVHGRGKVALTALQEMEKWREHGFELGFGNHYNGLYMKEYPCHRIQFPSGMRIPSSMPCPECRRPMHINKSFICCHEEHYADEVDEVLAAARDDDQYDA